MIIIPPGLILPSLETTITYVGSRGSPGVSGHLSQVLPVTGAQVGDFGIIFEGIWGETLAGSAFGVPSGWRQVYTNSGALVSGWLSILAKKLEAPDLVAFDTGTTIGPDASSQRRQMHVFRANNGFSDFASSTWNVGVTNGSQGARTISVAGQTAPLITFGFAGSYGAAFGWEGYPSPAFDASVGYDPGNEYMLTGYRIQNTEPVSGQSADISDPGSGNILGVGWIKIVP